MVMEAGKYNFFGYVSGVDATNMSESELMLVLEVKFQRSVFRMM